MQAVNVEGLYAALHAALPHLKRQRITPHGGRIIVVSPPIYSRFFRGKTAYAVGKVGMSVLTKGLAMDFERQGLVGGRNGGEGGGMAISSIWPAVVSGCIVRPDRPSDTTYPARPFLPTSYLLGTLHKICLHTIN